MEHYKQTKQVRDLRHIWAIWDLLTSVSYTTPPEGEFPWFCDHSDSDVLTKPNIKRCFLFRPKSLLGNLLVDLTLFAGFQKVSDLRQTCDTVECWICWSSQNASTWSADWHFFEGTKTQGGAWPPCPLPGSRYCLGYIKRQGIKYACFLTFASAKKRMG